MERDAESTGGEDQPSFEEAVRQLEQVVKDLESGDKTLDDALALYKRGRALSEVCDQYLQQAELTLKQWDQDKAEVVETNLNDRQKLTAHGKGPLQRKEFSNCRCSRFPASAP